MELDEIAELIEMASVGLNEYNSRERTAAEEDLITRRYNARCADAFKNLRLVMDIDDCSSPEDVVTYTARDQDRLRACENAIEILQKYLGIVYSDCPQTIADKAIRMIKELQEDKVEIEFHINQAAKAFDDLVEYFDLTDPDIPEYYAQEIKSKYAKSIDDLHAQRQEIDALASELKRTEKQLESFRYKHRQTNELYNQAIDVLNEINGIVNGVPDTDNTTAMANQHRRLQLVEDVRNLARESRDGLKCELEQAQDEIVNLKAFNDFARNAYKDCLETLNQINKIINDNNERMDSTAHQKVLVFDTYNLVKTLRELKEKEED